MAVCSGSSMSIYENRSNTFCWYWCIISAFVLEPRLWVTRRAERKCIHCLLCERHNNGFYVMPFLGLKNALTNWTGVSSVAAVG